MTSTHVPVRDYLQYSLEFKPEEEALCRFFGSWLPERIIDAHAHCNLEAHVEGMSESTYRHMLSTFPYYSLETSLELKRRFYGDRHTRTLRFAKTFKGVNHRAANEYLLANSPEGDRIAIFGLPEDVPYTTRMLKHPRCSALKMYWSYVTPPADRIYQFFLPAILEEAQALEIPIILHVPKMIVRCVGDVQTLLGDFPKLRVVIAHLGSTKMVVDGLAEAYEALSRHKNLLLDTSLNPSADVVYLALSAFGTERIMFGSDEPLNLIRSVPFEHPKLGQRLATEYPYHWVNAADFEAYKHLAANVTHSHWLSLTAVKGAIDKFPPAEREALKRRIFHDNAQACYGF
jgi:predicted TIM-barrel fold metal-dependent hydrolase